MAASFMFPTDTMIGMLNNRINLLQQRNPVVNANIIRKLKRRVRLLEKSKS